MLGEGRLDGVDVTPAPVLDAPRPADLGRLGERNVAILDQRLDLHLVGIGELVAVRAEQLDAVIIIRIVAGRDHDAQVRAHRGGEHGDGGRGNGAELDHVHADAGESGNQRILDHVAREARVLADHDAVAMMAAQEMAAGGHADAHRHLGGHGSLVGAAANAVRAEIAPAHGRSLVLSRFGPSLSKSRSCKEKGLPFDKLKANGRSRILSQAGRRAENGATSRRASSI